MSRDAISTWKLGLHPSVGQSVVIIQLTSPVVFDIIGITPFAPISYILTFDWRWCGMFHYQFPGFIGRQSILSTSFSPHDQTPGNLTCHWCDTIKSHKTQGPPPENITPPFLEAQTFELKYLSQSQSQTPSQSGEWSSLNKTLSAHLRPPFISRLPLLLCHLSFDPNKCWSKLVQAELS